MLHIAMFDIDDFKYVNDKFGHPFGDKILKHFAKVLTKFSDENGCTVCRYGGEEFVVGLIDTTPEGMIETAERIRHAVMDLEFDVHQASPLRVTVSIGAFLVKPDFHDMKKAVNNADQALYKAKESGRNQVIQYTDLTAEHVVVEKGA